MKFPGEDFRDGFISHEIFGIPENDEAHWGVFPIKMSCFSPGKRETRGPSREPATDPR